MIFHIFVLWLALLTGLIAREISPAFYLLTVALIALNWSF